MLGETFENSFSIGIGHLSLYVTVISNQNPSSGKKKMKKIKKMVVLFRSCGTGDIMELLTVYES